MSSTRRAASPHETSHPARLVSARYAGRYRGFARRASRQSAAIVRVVGARRAYVQCRDARARVEEHPVRLRIRVAHRIHAHDLERIDQLRPGHDSRRARAGDEAGRARSRTSRSGMLHRECMTPIKQKRWCPMHDREVDARTRSSGLGGGEGRVRDRRGRRPGGDRAAATPRARSTSRGSSRSARSTRSTSTAPISSCPPPHRRAPAVRAAAPRDAGGRGRRDRALRARGQGEALPDPREGRRARARDDVPRRGRLLAGRDRRGRRGHDVKKAELDLARQIVDSLVASSSRRSSSTSEYRAGSSRAARGEAAGPGDRRAGRSRRRR